MTHALPNQNIHSKYDIFIFIYSVFHCEAQCTRVAVNALRIYNLFCEFSGRELHPSVILRSITLGWFTSSVRNSFHLALHALCATLKTVPLYHAHPSYRCHSCFRSATFYDVIASGHDLPWCVVRCNEQN